MFAEFQLIEMKTFWDRFSGVMLKKDLKRDLYVFKDVPSIHSFFCKVPIDVLFLDKKKQVIKVIYPLQPWKIIWYVAQSKYLMEAAEGCFQALNIKVGDKVDW